MVREQGRLTANRPPAHADRLNTTGNPASDGQSARHQGSPRGPAKLLSGMAALYAFLFAGLALASGEKHVSEATLVLPDLSSVQFLGMSGKMLLTAGLGVCALAMVFGLVIYNQLKNMAVHRSMREISDLIYET